MFIYNELLIDSLIEIGNAKYNKMIYTLVKLTSILYYSMLITDANVSNVKHENISLKIPQLIGRILV